MKKGISKQTLFEHFSGQATPLQKKAIEEWLSELANRENYFAALDEWERQRLQYNPNEHEAFVSLCANIDRYEAEKFQVPAWQMPAAHPRFSARWFLVAASLTICMLTTGIYLNRSLIFYKTLTTTFGEVRREVLSDGSVVILNANSSLQLPRFGFGASSRSVVLTGEANFSVKHTKTNQPFIVKTNKSFSVTVLGTEFTMFARQRGSTIVLNKGKVVVNYQQATKPGQLAMQPGDIVSIDQKGTLKRTHTEKPDNHAAWQLRRYVFSQTSLLDIALMLEDNYGLNITIRDEALAHRTISGTFRATTADELLQVVTELLNANYNRQNNEVILFE